MNSIVKARKKPGSSPGHLFFVGDKKSEQTIISSFNYNETRFEENTHSTVAEALECRDNELNTWINIDGLHDTTVVEQLGTHFGIHPLVLEDIVSTTQRPKIEFYDDHVYVVMKMITFDDEEDDVVSEQVSMVLGHDYVLSFQEKPGDVFEPVRTRLRPPPGARIRRMPSDYLLYALIDVIVDYYFVTLEKLGEVIEDLEDEVSEYPSKETPLKLRSLKRNLIQMRRATWPVRELLGQMERSESQLITDATTPFIRDAYDHAVQAIDIVESLRDLLSGLMDLYMTGISNRMNDIMKVLTIMGTIFIPLTFIAGIYGMNFENMPELHTQYGYFISLGVMAVVALALLVFFRKKEWL